MEFWRRRAVPLVVVAALAGTPILAAACAAFCVPAAEAVTTCDGAASAHHAPVETEGPSIASVSGDCCDEDATAVEPAASPTSRRADAGGFAAAQASTGFAWTDSNPMLSRGAPPGTAEGEAPPGLERSPLVLRI